MFCSDINDYIYYLESWLSKADKVQDTISTTTIKFYTSNFTQFCQTIETLTSSICEPRGIILDYLFREDDDNNLDTHIEIA